MKVGICLYAGPSLLNSFPPHRFNKGALPSLPHSNLNIWCIWSAGIMYKGHTWRTSEKDRDFKPPLPCVNKIPLKISMGVRIFWVFLDPPGCLFWISPIAKGFVKITMIRRDIPPSVLLLCKSSWNDQIDDRNSWHTHIYSYCNKNFVCRCSISVCIIKEFSHRRIHTYSNHWYIS